MKPFPEKDPHVHKQTPQNSEHSVGFAKGAYPLRTLLYCTAQTLQDHYLTD